MGVYVIVLLCLVDRFSGGGSLGAWYKDFGDSVTIVAYFGGDAGPLNVYLRVEGTEFGDCQLANVCNAIEEGSGTCPDSGIERVGEVELRVDS